MKDPILYSITVLLYQESLVVMKHYGRNLSYDLFPNYWHVLRYPATRNKWKSGRNTQQLWDFWLQHATIKNILVATRNKRVIWQPATNSFLQLATKSEMMSISATIGKDVATDTLSKYLNTCPQLIIY